MGQCFPERQREQLLFGGSSTVLRRRPYFRLGMPIDLTRRSSKIAVFSRFFEPRHVLHRLWDLDVRSLSILVFTGFEGRGCCLGFFNDFFCDLLALTDGFFGSGLGCFSRFFG